MSGIRKDLRFALRLLWTRPGFTLTVVLCMAVGIGATTSLYSLVEAIFLRPLPLHETHRLVAVFGTDEEATRATGLTHLPISLPNYRDVAEQSTTFSGLTAYTWTTLSFAGEGEPERIPGQLVTTNFFDVLGVPAEHGRTFTRTDDRSPVAVLSHRAWRQRFGSDPDAVGQPVRLNAHTFTIVGVAPPGFRGTSTVGAPELWVPMGMHPQVYAQTADLEHRKWRLLSVAGRLAPGATMQEARSELATIAARLESEFPADNEDRGMKALALADAVVHPDQMGQVARAGALPVVIAVLVLLVACISVACLLLARASTRYHEIAVRTSLGATRGQVIRQLLIESVALSLAGGLAGLCLAYWSQEILWSFMPPMLTAGALDLRMSWSVLSFNLAISLVTGLLFGAAPAIQVSRPRIAWLLKSRLPSNRLRLAFRSVLITGQIALATVAIVAAGLFLRSLDHAQDVDLGFVPEGVATLSFDLGAQGYDAERRRQFQDRLLEAARTEPGVIGAALSQNAPLGSSPSVLRRVVAEGRPAESASDGTLVLANAISPDYLEVLGTPLERGRAFQASDRAGSRPVAIVNAAAAETLWPDENALGRRLSFVGEEGSFEVVGVARNARYDDVTLADQPYVFVPLAQRDAAAVALAVRADGAVDAVVERVRRRVARLDPDLPVIDAGAVTDRISTSLWAPRLAASLLGLFGVLALAITSVGLYGVVAHSVTGRRREIGIRLSLGAQRGEVLWMILRWSLVIAGVGITVGLAGALAGNRFLRSLLYGVEPNDATVLAAATVILLLVVGLAALIPARRASRIDPARALRTE